MSDSPIRQLWAHLFGELTGYLGLFSGQRVPSRRELQAIAERFYPYPHSAAAAEAWLLQEDDRRRETYFCCHLLTKQRRVKENAAEVLALWVDGDGAQVPPHLPQPTAVVESSPGRQQYYWRLSRPIAPTQAEHLNQRLAYAIGADKSGWDLTQLMRPPGTHHHKRPETRPIVVLVEIGEGGHVPS